MKKYSKTTATLSILFVSLFLQIAQAQTKKEEYKYPENEEDSIACLENINVFDNQFNADKYDNVLAQKAWRQAFNHCPQSTRLIYQKGEKLYRHLIGEARKAKDDSAFQAYVDTLMMVYDKRLEVFGEYGDSSVTIGLKSIYLYVYRNNKFDALKDVVRLSETHMRLAADDSNYIYMVPKVYFGAMDRLVKYKKLDTNYIINRYIQYIDIIKKMAAEEDADKWQKTLDDVESVMSKYLNCEVLIPLYEKTIETDKNLEAEDFESMVQMLSRKGCDESDVYFLAAEKLCELVPSASCKLALGDKALREDRFEEAKGFYQEALEMEKDDQTLISSIWMKISSAHLETGANSSAISAAQKSLNANPNNGRAYLIMASAYTNIARATCNGDNFERAATYWVIVDYYNKAKAVDPSLTERVNKAIANHNQYYPSREEIFFKDLEMGQKWTVPCLGIETTVRERP